MSYQLRPPERRSLSEQICDTLRRAIYEGTLAPGARLVETSIADELKVSRGPVREAISQLEREGLVEQYPHRGASVAVLDARDAWELYTLRAQLESWAVDLAWDQLTNYHTERYRQLIQQMEALEPGEIQKAVELDLAYHRVLVKATGHQLLIRTHSMLDTMVGALFLTVKTKLGSTAADMVKVHQPIHQALVAGDRDAFKVAIERHWINTGERLLAQSTPTKDGTT